MPTDTLILKGLGPPGGRCGLSRSPFRPSDDATLLPFLVPANAMAAVELKELAKMQRGFVGLVGLVRFYLSQ